MGTSTKSTLRTILTLLAGCVLLVLVMMLGTYWRLKYRSRQAGDVLAAEAWALTTASERVARPSHTDPPLPGTLHEALEPLMPELRSLRADEGMLSSDNTLLQQYEDVQHGRRPLSELPGPYRELFEQDRLLMQRALRASRTEMGGLPKGLRDLDEPDHRVSIELFSSVFGLAALDVWSHLENGQAGAALETCLDGLALSRDVAYGSGTSGARISASGYESLFHPCANALGRATPEGRKQATLALRRIREGLRPLSWALREESVSFSLNLAGEVLAPEQLEALPEGARYQALHPPSSCMEPDLKFLIYVLHDWPKRMEYLQQAAPLMDLPSEQRHARLVALERLSESMWALGAGASWASSYEESAAHVDGQRARVDLLLALALVKAHRAEHGTWPTTLPPLHPEREVLLPTVLKLQPAEGDTLRLVPEATALQELALTATP
ncbi:resistance to Congo red protein [Archangium lansingense]|uniref:Resistance to Congo red protein n=1 Tax=Archangium lansingense TaxID=2995310 RepID=A0ABT4AHQ0_9BACT|nr:resistance to Congo red protein [Archangium lansinium]MCY1080841.1 resistance to Congo red protein [Archangium lansinium]